MFPLINFFAKSTGSSTWIRCGSSCGLSTAIPGRPSIDPELIIRMLVIGYVMGIRSERRLCQEVHLNLAYRWFCRLGLEDRLPDNSTFSRYRHGKFRESGLFRRLIEDAGDVAGLAQGLIGSALNPQLFLITGGLALAEDLFLAPLEAAYERHTLCRPSLLPISERTEIGFGHFLNNDNVLGAAVLVLRQVSRVA